MSIKCRAYKQYQKHLIAVARLLACSSVFRKLFADCVPVLWLIALANTCEQNETSANTAYARLEHLRSSSERQRGMSDKRSAESGVASEMSFENKEIVTRGRRIGNDLTYSFDIGRIK